MGDYYNLMFSSNHFDSIHQCSSMIFKKKKIYLRQSKTSWCKITSNGDPALNDSQLGGAEHEKFWKNPEIYCPSEFTMKYFDYQ